MMMYGHVVSSASYRVRIALALKGLQVGTVLLDLRAGEQTLEQYLQVNSQGLVPHPRIVGIDAACRELPAFQSAAPDRQSKAT